MPRVRRSISKRRSSKRHRRSKRRATRSRQFRSSSSGKNVTRAPSSMQSHEPNDTSTPVSWSKIVESIKRKIYEDDSAKTDEEMDKNSRYVWNELLHMYPNSTIPKEVVSIKVSTRKGLKDAIDNIVNPS